MTKVNWCFKIIVVGDSGVGKTCLLRRFVHNDFTQQYRKTVGAQFAQKDIILRSINASVHLMLWDTAGLEEFNVLTQAYYRGAAAAILTFSAADRVSFNNIGTWKSKVQSVCGPIAMILCQTKMDLTSDSGVRSVQAEQLAQQLKIPYFRVSTKDNFNVKHLFQFIAQLCVEAQTQFAVLNASNILSINSNGSYAQKNVSNTHISQQMNKNKQQPDKLKTQLNNIASVANTLTDVNARSAFSFNESAIATNFPQQSRNDDKEVVHLVPTTNSLGIVGVSNNDNNNKSYQKHHHHDDHKMKNQNSNAQQNDANTNRKLQADICQRIKQNKVINTKAVSPMQSQKGNGKQNINYRDKDKYNKNIRQWRQQEIKKGKKKKKKGKKVKCTLM